MDVPRREFSTYVNRVSQTLKDASSKGDMEMRDGAIVSLRFLALYSLQEASSGTKTARRNVEELKGIR
jgi:hypothetical protein